MRILGIDYGSKRIGIAASDPEGQFALPLAVIKNSKASYEEIVELARQNEAKDIVIGESRDYKGQPNPIMAEALELKSHLEREGFFVHLEPEFMTSHQADRLHHELGGTSGDKDASAAAIILQSYLDRK